MSYILDALKKADSERHLGDLPGLHSQAVVTGAALSSTIWQHRSRWAKLALAVAMVLLVVAFQFWPRGVAHRLPEQIGPAVATRAVAEVPPVAAAPVTAVATELPVPPPLPTLPVAAALAVESSTNVRKPLTQSPRPADKPTGKAVDKPVDMSVERRPTLNLLAELPPNLQREIPTLAIAGSIYSTTPADRMLLIDKRMLHEGDEISPGLVLESVQPKSAVLRYKGYRFKVIF
ncbi:MAG: general secretion pathway protein GspB [Herminiimonas sp.]|nr:general secretion pathway protein GspB [Herminiimonas sp.]